jgi:hypothetical protein
MAQAKTKSKSITVDNDFIIQVESYPSAYGKTDFSTKVREIVQDLHYNLIRTRKEIEDIFLEPEWNYIREMLNSTLLTSGNISYQFILAAQVKEVDKLEGLGKRFNVNPDVLAEKITNLSEFQCYTVAKIVDQEKISR